MESVTHLIVAIGDDNRTYIHGPVIDPEQKAWVMRMLIDVANTAKINLQELANQEELFNERHPVTMTIQ
jgi:hypothetical protein